MAAERDQAGAPGPDLSGGGRPLEGMPGSPGMGGPGRGSAEVRSGLHGGARTDEPYAGLGFAGGDRPGGVADRTREAARDENLAGRARHLADDLGHRASDAASAARERVSGLRDRTNQVLEKRGVVDRLRENPLPILGIAFAVGFLLSGSAERDSDSRADRARRELRSALMAGLTTGIAQGVRSFLNETGEEGSGFVNSLLDTMTGQAKQHASGERAGTAGEAPYRRGAARPPSHRENV